MNNENHYNFHGQPIEYDSLIFEIKHLKDFYINHYVDNFCKDHRIKIEDAETLKVQIALLIDGAVKMVDDRIELEKIYTKLQNKKNN